MASKSMKHLFDLGKIKFYWADNSFMYKGLWIWNGNRNLRVLALNQFKNWSGQDKES